MLFCHQKTHERHYKHMPTMHTSDEVLVRAEAASYVQCTQLDDQRSSTQATYFSRRHARTHLKACQELFAFLQLFSEVWVATVVGAPIHLSEACIL